LLAAIVMQQGRHFSPFLSPLLPFLVPLVVAFDGAAQTPLAATFSLCR
jgi:hypothetical protein